MPIFNTVVGGGSGIGASALNFQILLTYQDWVNDDEDVTVSYQTVTNDNFVIDGYSYFVSPSQDYYQEYIDASIRAFDINTEGSIQFCCLADSKPKRNIYVDILRVDEVYDE